MTGIPWLSGLPSPDAVATHAKAYPIDGAKRWGYWLRWDPAYRRSELISLRRTPCAQVSRERFDLGMNPALHENARFLPCAADGVPLFALEGYT